jgi:hypothetical protein
MTTRSSFARSFSGSSLEAVDRRERRQVARDDALFGRDGCLLEGVDGAVCGRGGRRGDHGAVGLFGRRSGHPREAVISTSCAMRLAVLRNSVQSAEITLRGTPKRRGVLLPRHLDAE